MMKNKCFLGFILLLLFFPVCYVSAKTCKYEGGLMSVCEQAASNRCVAEEILYQVLGLSFEKSGVVFKGWAVMHDVHNKTFGENPPTRIYIKLNGNEINGSSINSCSFNAAQNSYTCITSSGKTFETSENPSSSDWENHNGTYYLKDYKLYNYFVDTTTPGVINYNYDGNYFYIFLDYDDLISDNDYGNNFQICVEHRSGSGEKTEKCQEMAVSKDRCYKRVASGKTVNCSDSGETIAAKGIDFNVSGLSGKVLINYSQSRKHARVEKGSKITKSSTDSKGKPTGYFEWCKEYPFKELTGKYTYASCGVSDSSKCPLFYQVYHKEDVYNNTVGFFKSPGGLENCPLKPGEGNTKNCLVPTNSGPGVSTDRYLLGTFGQAVGSLNIKIESSYGLNQLQCNVKNTLKVSSNITSNSDYQKTSYSRYKKQNNLMDDTESNKFYEYVKVDGEYFGVDANGRFVAKNQKTKSTDATGGNLGGDCIQTIKVKLDDGSYAYANIAFSEISTWNFVNLPNNVEAGRHFDFGINYTSEVTWDIVNNIATKNDKADPSVWILIEKEGEKDKYYKSEDVIHEQALEKISDFIEGEMYKKYSSNNDNLKDVLLIPKDNAQSEDDMEEISSNWECEIESEGRTNNKKGSRKVSCYYDLDTYLNRFNAKVSYTKPNDSINNYFVYNKENKNDCIREDNNNGFCLFVSMTYPCYSVVKNEGNVYKGGFPIKYYSYETNSNDEFVTVSQLNFNTKYGGIIKLETGGQLGIDLDVIYEGRINVGDSKYDSGEYDICLMSLLDYRPINLNNPFPKELNSAGYNWTNYLNAYWTEKGDIQDNVYKNVNTDNVFSNYDNLEYQISLDFDIIEDIKEKNKNYNYLSFSEISSGDKATSSFVSVYFGDKINGRNGTKENKIYKLCCGPASDEGSGC